MNLLQLKNSKVIFPSNSGRPSEVDQVGSSIPGGLGAGDLRRDFVGAHLGLGEAVRGPPDAEQALQGRHDVDGGGPGGGPVQPDGAHRAAGGGVGRPSNPILSH